MMQDDKQFVSTEQAAAAFEGIDDEIGVEAPVFMAITDYTTFRAEYAVLDDDLVFHFYATDEVNKLPDPWRYWKTTFARALAKVAKDHFQAEYPRVKAAYTDELASWWLRADRYGHVLDMDEFAKRFLSKLDQELDAELKSS